MAVGFVRPTTFRYEEDGAIATITLSRPERLNALTFDVYAELADLFTALNARDHIRCVVITGAGRGFCSGVRAPAGNCVRVRPSRATSASRGSSRSGIAAMFSPSAGAVGRSL